MPNGADIIAKRLYAQGCRVAFGMPGGEVLAIVEALEKAGIRFVLVKHENAGGFMAEGFWHRQAEELQAGGSQPDGARIPGILVATLGPGAANAANVVANAHQDRVPLIFLTGRVDAAEAESYTHQVFDHQAMFRPITKASLAASAGAVHRVIDRAVAIATEGQFGPVHLDVPIGVAEGEEPEVAFSRPAPKRIAPAPDNLADIAAIIRNSRNAVMLAGVDAVNHGASRAVTAFAEQLAVPMLTTYKAKGLIPEDHPLAAGGFGLSPKADKLALPFLADADCIILAGYDPIEMRINWRDPFPPGLPIIEIAATLPTHQMHRADHLLIGDVADMLDALRAAAGSREAHSPEAIQALKSALAAAFAPEPEWGPGVAFETIRRLAPRDALATADSGAHRILLSQMWRSYEPRGLMQSSALCTMGCAVPLAMGAQMASPERVIIAFVGDAGFEMGVGELATARDLGLPVIIVVMQDERLALIDLKQRASNRPQAGVAFGATDFAAVARAFGGAGETVRNRDELEAAFSAALANRHSFSVIAVKIAPDAYQGKF